MGNFVMLRWLFYPSRPVLSLEGSEHVQNNQSVRDTLGSRGIKPEELPPSEDIKKLERRVKSQEKKLVQESGKLPQTK